MLVLTRSRAYRFLFTIYHLKDAVLAQAADPERPEIVSFRKILKNSGRKTVQARPEHFSLDDDKGVRLLEAVHKIGCEFEKLPPCLLAVDVSSDAALDQLTRFLTVARIP